MNEHSINKAAATAAIAGAPGKPSEAWRYATVLGLALIVPALLLAMWWSLVVWTGTTLVPLPQTVAVMIWDFTFGGVYDDAYSGTLLPHLMASARRVFLGFG